MKHLLLFVLLTAAAFGQGHTLLPPVQDLSPINSRLTNIGYYGDFNVSPSLDKYRNIDGWDCIYLDSARGNDANDGSSWLKAKKTLKGVADIVNYRQNRGWGFAVADTGIPGYERSNYWRFEQDPAHIRIWVKPGTYQATNFVNSKTHLIFTAVTRNDLDYALSLPESDRFWRKHMFNLDQVPAEYHENIPYDRPITIEGDWYFNNIKEVTIRVGVWNIPIIWHIRGTLQMNNIEFSLLQGLRLIPPASSQYGIQVTNVNLLELGPIHATADSLSSNTSNNWATGTSDTRGLIKFVGDCGILTWTGWPARELGTPVSSYTKPYQFVGIRQIMTVQNDSRLYGKPAKAHPISMGNAGRITFHPNAYYYNKGFLTGSDTTARVRVTSRSEVDISYHNGPGIVASDRLDYVISSYPIIGRISLTNRATNTGGVYYPGVVTKDSSNLRSNFVDGSIFATNTYGQGDTVSFKGTGSKFIWSQRKAALRAGFVGGTQWESWNVGNYSAAFGLNTYAQDTAQFSVGAYNDITMPNQRFSVGIGTATGSRNGLTVYKNGDWGATDQVRGSAVISTGDSIQVTLNGVLPSDIFVVSYTGKYTAGASETLPSFAVLTSNKVTFYGVTGRTINYIRLK